MFDLEREVDAWSKKAYGGPCRDKAASLDELKDHLHCEIERLVADGKPREEAFRMATEKLGEPTRRRCRGRDGETLSRGRLALAVIWASVILGSALLLSKSNVGEAYSFLLLFILGPAWWMSDQILSRYARAAKDH